MKFNNKILLLIVVLSIVIGLLMSNYIPFLNSYGTITPICLFFAAIMCYNAILKGRELKASKKEKAVTQMSQSPKADNESSSKTETNK